MTPSKLNELAAVRVMEAVTIGLNDPIPNGVYIRRAMPYYGADGGNRRCDPFRPSESIADAWRLVEKMGEQGFTANVEWKGTGRGYANTAEVSFWKGIVTEGHAVGAAPMAITLAALRAVGVTEEEMK